jgi:hypothetical protein
MKNKMEKTQEGVKEIWKERKKREREREKERA